MRRDGNRSAEKLKSEIAGGRIPLRRKGHDRMIREFALNRVSRFLANGEFSEIPVHHLPMRST